MRVASTSLATMLVVIVGKTLKHLMRLEKRRELAVTIVVRGGTATKMAVLLTVKAVTMTVVTVTT